MDTVGKRWRRCGGCEEVLGEVSGRCQVSVGEVMEGVGKCGETCQVSMGERCVEGLRRGGGCGGGA